MNLKKISSLLAFLFSLNFLGFGQLLTFYKIQNDTKTILTSQDLVNFQLNENYVPDGNLLIEVNLELFKKTTKYNLVSLALIANHSAESRSVYENVDLNFESEYYANKYATDKILRVYFFGTNTVKSDPKNMYFFNDRLVYESATIEWSFSLRGSYKTGSETYFDDNTLKTRDVFSKYEVVPTNQTVMTKFTIPSSAILAYKYDLYIQPNGRASGDIKGVKTIENKLFDECLQIESIKENVLVINYVSIYLQVSESIKLVSSSRSNAILNEPDKEKALEMLKDWNNEYSYLLVIEKSSEASLKALNKSLKGKTDVNEILTIFKNYKGG